MKSDKKQQIEGILEMSRALLSSMNSVIDSIPESGPIGHFGSYKLYARQYNRLVQRVIELEQSTQGFLFYYDEAKIPGNAMHVHAHSYFQDVHGNLSMLCAWIDSELVCCPRNNCGKSFYLVQDGLSSRSPNERTGVCIVVGHKLLDLVDELLH